MLKLPTNWSEVSISNYVKFREEKDVINQIAILSDSPIDEVMKLSYREVRSILASLTWLSSPPTETPNKIHGTDFYKKTLGKMCVFEFRTYDYYSGENAHKYIPELIATMYQLKSDKWGEFDLSERASLFKDLTMEYWGLVEFREFKRLCFEKYPLSSEKETEEEIDTSNLNYLQRAELKQQQEKDKINRSLNWELIMLQLNNDSMIDAYNSQFLPVIYAFRLISARKLNT